MRPLLAIYFDPALLPVDNPIFSDAATRIEIELYNSVTTFVFLARRQNFCDQLRSDTQMAVLVQPNSKAFIAVLMTEELP